MNTNTVLLVMVLVQIIYTALIQYNAAKERKDLYNRIMVNDAREYMTMSQPQNDSIIDQGKKRNRPINAMRDKELFKE